MDLLHCKINRENRNYRSECRHVRNTYVPFENICFYPCPDRFTDDLVAYFYTTLPSAPSIELYSKAD